MEGIPGSPRVCERLGRSLPHACTTASSTVYASRTSVVPVEVPSERSIDVSSCSSDWKGFGAGMPLLQSTRRRRLVPFSLVP